MLVPYFTKAGDREDAMKGIIDPFRRRWPLEVMLREALQNSVGAKATKFEIRVGMTGKPGSELFGCGTGEVESGIIDAIFTRLSAARPLAYIDMRDNGTGLPDISAEMDKNPWFIFTQTIGINYHMQGELAGGSKGKGRFSFALASEPRTFIVYTRFYDDEGKARFNLQGFSVAEINHKGFGGELFWGTGSPSSKRASLPYDSPEVETMLSYLESFGIERQALEGWKGTGVIVIEPWFSDEERKHWAPLAKCGEVIQEMGEGECCAPEAIRGEFKDRAVRLLSAVCEWNFWNRLVDPDSIDISIICDTKRIGREDLLNHAKAIPVLGDYCSMWKNLLEGAPNVRQMRKVGKLVASIVPLNAEERHDIKAMNIYPTFLEEWIGEADGGANPLEGHAVVARFREIGNLVDYFLMDRVTAAGALGDAGPGVVLAIALVDNREDGLQEKLRDCENATHSEWDEDVFKAKGNPVKKVMRAIRGAIKEAREETIPPIITGVETRISPVISELANLMRLKRVGKSRKKDGGDGGEGGTEGSGARIEINNLHIDRDARKMFFTLGDSRSLAGCPLDFCIKIASITKDEVAAEFRKGEFQEKQFDIANGAFALVHPGTSSTVAVDLPEKYLEYALTLEAKPRRQDSGNAYEGEGQI